MRFLLDQPISRAVADALKAAGHEAQHVAELGLCQADDATILDLAKERNAVVISQDTDYGTLLAARRTALPSVILFRMRDGRPALHAHVLLQNLPAIQDAISAGAIVVFSEKGIRVRMLPVIR